MEKIIIRKATIEDLVSIQELNNSLFELEYENLDDTLKKEWPFQKEGKEYFEYMINDEMVFVAQDKDRIVGYLAGSICEQINYVTETFAELDNMCIDDNYRRIFNLWYKYNNMKGTYVYVKTDILEKPDIHFMVSKDKDEITIVNKNENIL